MTTLDIETQKKSLALSIACGLSVRLWAKQYDVDVETALEWSLEKEIRPLVEQARLRVADRMVGRLLRGAKVALIQLRKLCTQGTTEAIRLSACRAVIAGWLKVSEHFSQQACMNEIKTMLDRHESQTGAWIPPSPYAFDYPSQPHPKR